MVKVGDSVKYTGETRNDLTSGKIYTVSAISHSRESVFGVMDDVGDENFLVYDHYLIVDNELDELRAFKADALARFPELDKPETDEAAAERLSTEYYDGTAYAFVIDVVRAAIEWARANPR